MIFTNAHIFIFFKFIYENTFNFILIKKNFTILKLAYRFTKNVNE